MGWRRYEMLVNRAGSSDCFEPKFLARTLNRVSFPNVFSRDGAQESTGQRNKVQRVAEG
ncbi:hypothetical protein CY34DRAFT_807903 [Suillus luteus UH-Slu-Lm8-n1]|uniref:Unplaced genomic scaffold CY34scaffold_198, whole genome shotgun sequence n=1 Tax=Suillus luteus UH-Slu-Lm8-n1 TaxID=930992 RepID=A0A0D0AP26_9AGAM|nr:hypothetical protein CY34DRAFT_807903 [Suillus luteus UH-Slu-Lm8-n1]